MRNNNVSTIHKCSWVAQHPLVGLYVYIASMTLVLFVWTHCSHELSSLQHLLFPLQFGFRPGSSTQAARHYHLVSGHSVTLVSSKLLTESPTVNSVISTLSNIRVSGSLLKWFRCYLSNWSQKVVLDGHFSTSIAVTSRVPKGSMLGLLLFSIYMNPLTTISVSQDSSSLIFYANDIILYWPIRTLRCWAPAIWCWENLQLTWP